MADTAALQDQARALVAQVSRRKAEMRRLRARLSSDSAALAAVVEQLRALGIEFIPPARTGVEGDLHGRPIDNETTGRRTAGIQA